MSQADVSRFVTRALDDANLREQLEKNPGEAFKSFDLTDDERDAIRAADEQRLRSLGLDPLTARSWRAFHDTAQFAPDRPDIPGDLSPEK